MQNDQTSLVRLEIGDNDQKKKEKRNVSGKYLRRDRSTEDYFPYFYTAGHVFATRRLTPCWSFELILVYYHFTFVSLCKLHLLYTVYARAKPLAWLKRKANFSLMHSLDTKELKIMAASSFHVSILGELFA